ncbi:glycopeptide [Macrolepiota fuliginosa MF-IS2]|uniref:Glycopeptide n=1 Tax=Macrolepiota fuliginosa MF-IS2 TaxID=1400762 RepID=A0A9P5XCT1_9AGAR|nr:glycopeptide [Macrolepiota fuliginosa MF-IS2]
MAGILRRLVWLIVGGFGVFRGVGAEQHRVRFDNRCGYGIPHLLKDGNVLSQGEEFVSNGSFTSGIAYLQTGDCNLNGEGCTLVEMTLTNPVCPGCGSSVDISLIPPLAYSVPTSFSYFNGCDGNSAACSSPGCGVAFFTPNDDRVQVQCEEHDVGIPL